MKLERIPKYRIPLDSDSYLVVERDEEGWHLVGDGDMLGDGCLFIPHAAVGLLVEALTGPDDWDAIAADGSFAVKDLGCSQGVSFQPETPEVPIAPDPGYRAVGEEYILEGDQFKCADGRAVDVVACIGSTWQGAPNCILQRRDPDAVAAGHNPDKLTNAQVGVYDGWRLLTEAENKQFRDKTVRPTHYWCRISDRWSTECNDWQADAVSTLRTKTEKLEVVS